MKQVGITCLNCGWKGRLISFSKAARDKPNFFQFSTPCPKCNQSKTFINDEGFPLWTVALMVVCFILAIPVILMALAYILL